MSTPDPKVTGGNEHGNTEHAKHERILEAIGEVALSAKE